MLEGSKEGASLKHHHKSEIAMQLVHRSIRMIDLILAVGMAASILAYTCLPKNFQECMALDRGEPVVLIDWL